jgi:hypothetical protein
MIRSVSLTVLLALLEVCGRNIAAASPTFFVDNPSRPPDSKRIMATVGTVTAYTLYATGSLLSPRITILDDVMHKQRTFSLSFKTTIDDLPLQCHGDITKTDYWAAAQYITSFDLCHKLPTSITIGKTKVVVLYWIPERATPPANLLHLFDTEPASDAMWVVPT